jgi:hypothetical protein
MAALKVNSLVRFLPINGRSTLQKEAKERVDIVTAKTQELLFAGRALPTCSIPFIWVARQTLVLLWLVILSSARIFSAEVIDDIGPIYDRVVLTLDAGERREIFGPLFSFERRELAEGWTLAPFASVWKDPSTDFTEFDLLYPLLTYDRFGSEERVQLLQVLSHSGGRNQQGDSQSRFTIFPFFFYQKSAELGASYLAVLPFYGHLKGRLLRDEIDVVLFPLYSKTRKRDVVTCNYLYPLFHRRTGDKLTGWQFWPLFGTEHREVTSRTDQFGTSEVVGGFNRKFILWPFFFSNDLGQGTENPEKQRVLLPFFSIQRSVLRDSTTYFWPFGFTSTEDREKKYREWGAPWPLVVFARGEGKTVNRIWPLFGRAKSSTLESDFYLWPLYKLNRVTSEPLERTRTRILLFLYSDLIERNTAAGTAFHRRDLWPLFTARKDHNGNERLQLLAPLEPLLPTSRSIQRNYSPLWSIWRSESNAKTGSASQSFLWNLYRSDRTPNSRKYSALLGLFQYESSSQSKRWRIFFIPFGKKAPKASPQSNG